MISSVPASLSAERRFYTGMALLMIATVLIGFGPSFYFRGYMHFPRPNPTISPLVLMHGLAFSLWMLIFLTQSVLVSVNRRDLHMRLGQFSMVLFILLVPLMYLTSVGQIARANQPPGFSPLSWSVVPLLPIPGFALIGWLGWRYRRDPQTHKRLMLGATIMMMDPALGRMPLAPPTLSGFAVNNTIAWCFFLPLIWSDIKTCGKLHWATTLGATLFGGALLLRLGSLAYPGPWESFAAHLPGV